MKSTLYTFPEFGGEIKLYTKDGNKKIDKKLEKETWKNNIYTREGLARQKKWLVMSDIHKRRLTPIMFESSYTASQEDQCCDEYETIRYYRTLVTGTKDWFKTPVFCPK